MSNLENFLEEVPSKGTPGEHLRFFIRQRGEAGEGIPGREKKVCKGMGVQKSENMG